MLLLYFTFFHVRGPLPMSSPSMTSTSSAIANNGHQVCCRVTSFQPMPWTNVARSCDHGQVCCHTVPVNAMDLMFLGVVVMLTDSSHVSILKIELKDESEAFALELKSLLRYREIRTTTI